MSIASPGSATAMTPSPSARVLRVYMDNSTELYHEFHVTESTTASEVRDMIVAKTKLPRTVAIKCVIFAVMRKPGGRYGSCTMKQLTDSDKPLTLMTRSTGAVVFRFKDSTTPLDFNGDEFDATVAKASAGASSSSSSGGGSSSSSSSAAAKASSSRGAAAKATKQLPPGVPRFLWWPRSSSTGGPRMCGFLLKRSQKQRNLWKRRWFCLHDNVLWYCRVQPLGGGGSSSKGAGSPRDGGGAEEDAKSISLVGVQDVQISSVKKIAGCFEFSTPRRPYHLRVPPGSEKRVRDQWVDALRRAASFAQENDHIATADMIASDCEWRAAAADKRVIDDLVSSFDSFLQNKAARALLKEHMTAENNFEQLTFVTAAQSYAKECAALRTRRDSEAGVDGEDDPSSSSSGRQQQQQRQQDQYSSPVQSEHPPLAAEDLWRMAQQIYVSFCLEGAPKELAMRSSQRDRIFELLEEHNQSLVEAGSPGGLSPSAAGRNATQPPPADLFAELEQQVKRAIRDGPFLRFNRTTEFTALMHTLPIEKPRGQLKHSRGWTAKVSESLCRGLALSLLHLSAIFIDLSSPANEYATSLTSSSFFFFSPFPLPFWLSRISTRLHGASWIVAPLKNGAVRGPCQGRATPCGQGASASSSNERRSDTHRSLL